MDHIRKSHAKARSREGRQRKFSTSLRLCVFARDILAFTSCAREPDLIESQLDVLLNLSRALDVSRHPFADRIVNIAVGVQAIRLTSYLRQQLDHRLSLRFSHAEDQFRLGSQLRRQ